MESETLEQRLARLEGISWRFTEALDRAVHDAVKGLGPDQREFATRQIPMWQREIASWDAMLAELRRAVADADAGSH